MTIPTDVQDNKTELKTDEINLAKQRKFYERQLEQERQARATAEQEREQYKLQAEERQKSRNREIEEDDDESSPYIERKTLKKELNRFGEQNRQQTDQQIQQAVELALAQERKNQYIKENKDFEKIMQSEELLQRFADEQPDLADTILKIKDPFERHKLVYQNIKAIGLDKPKKQESTIQEKVDMNRQNGAYQPSGIGSSGFTSSGDFSKDGQKKAYEKVQELKSRLRV